jgi:hypothetical protein
MGPLGIPEFYENRLCLSRSVGCSIEAQDDLSPTKWEIKGPGIMIETGNTTNLILWSIEVIAGGKGIRLIQLCQMDQCNQYGTRRYHQAKFGGLIGVWKIVPSREFKQYQRQRLGE